MVCGNITDESICGVYGDGWLMALRGCIPRCCGGIA